MPKQNGVKDEEEDLFSPLREGMCPRGQKNRPLSCVCIVLYKLFSQFRPSDFLDHKAFSIGISLFGTGQ